MIKISLNYFYVNFNGNKYLLNLIKKIKVCDHSDDSIILCYKKYIDNIYMLRCGCKDDTIETKRTILKQFNVNRVKDDGKTIYIGIVFHICFNNYQVSNIEADIQYTIDLLNKDFNKQCSNFNIGANKYTNISLKQTYDQYIALADKCNIQFYLVSIKYMPLDVQTSSNISVLDNNIKKKSPPVQPDRYLNLWIADLSNSILGYAQFPWDNSPETDGVVIAKGTFGRNPQYSQYNLNKTMTHEVGHWLGLYHTFQETFAYGGGNINYQDGTPEEEIQEMKGDCVVDTPPQAQPTYGNPFNTPNTWPSSKPRDETKSYRHMFMNFMDYSDDIALFMFTRDQTIKIRQFVYIYRPNILLNTLQTPSQSEPQPVQTPFDSPSVPQPVPSEPEPQIPSQPVPSEPEPQIPSQPIPSEPEPQIPQQITTINYDFESFNAEGWASDLILLNSNIMIADAQITTIRPNSGSRCLRTRRSGRGELKINLTGTVDAIVVFTIKADNPNTYIWVKPPGHTTWYSVNIQKNYDYKQYAFTLPKPYSSIGQDHYGIRFGTNGSNIIYSYFDNISVIKK